MGDNSGGRRRRNCDGERADFEDVTAEVWSAGEDTAAEAIRSVHPTLDSEEKRRDVIDYIQKLIRNTLFSEVYPYGSVPLKTYLPDGDIDLTVITGLNGMETLPRDVLAVLQSEEANPCAEYEVKDTQFIDAEVKLVKCLVENIVVDLSFNQLGGLSTLCFLEQVDRRVCQNHLFKRSIILVKTWCYYESRILGAHHGLISTYAMETLVLYIFHLFHASLNGPLAVLYKFLDYFSKFDWENYCISLNGPVRKSCLPDIVVDMADGVQNNCFISEEFLNNCIDMFAVPSRDADTKLQVFPEKFLNIIDPLKESNNLGRSVNKGNYYRIRSAFRFGARKLGKILALPRERIADEIKRFFANTFERHGRNERKEKIQFNSLSLYLESNSGGDFELDRYSTEINHIPRVPKMGHAIGEMGISVSLPIGEMYPKPTTYQFNCSAPARYNNDPVSHYYPIHEKPDSDSSIAGQKDNYYVRPNSVGYYSSDNYDIFSNFSPDGSISEDLALDFRDKDLADIAMSPENSNPLSNLSGDYDSNIRSLLYGQFCHGHPSSSRLTMYNPPPFFASQFVSPFSWNMAPPPPPPPPPPPYLQAMSMNHCSSSQFIDNGYNMGWAPHPANISVQPNPVLYFEERPNKPRGTGTYLPIGCLNRGDKATRGRGKYQGNGTFRQYQQRPQRPRSGSALADKNPSEKRDTTHEQQPLKDPTPPPLHDKTEIPLESNTSSSDESQTSNFVLGKLEFGSLGNLTDRSTVRASDTSSGWNSIPSKVKSGEPLYGTSNYERVVNQSYRLKDEDFPPLTV